jgi:hypothetical protein
MTQEEIVKYTDHLLAEFYKDCQKQFNKENRQVDIVLTDGDFSTLQNIMCETIINNQNQMIDKACEYLESALKHDLGYYGAADFADTFRKAMEE